MKFDKFTWIVIAIVVLTLAGAVITVNLTSGRGWGSSGYLSAEDSPAAPVYNAFVALQKGDLPEARKQYSAKVLGDLEKDQAPNPLSGQAYYDPESARRLRILAVEMDAEDEDRAFVTFVEDNFANRGPFGSGSSYSYRRTVEVIREDEKWKINTPEFFY